MKSNKILGLPILELRFAEGPHYELRSTYFQKDARTQPLETSRSRGKRQISWTRGVHALSIFMVEFVAWSTVNDPIDYEVRGETGSPVASLDRALGKGKTNGWMGHMFGDEKGSGKPWICSYIERLNADKKRRVDPYALRIRATQFKPGNLRIVVGEKEVTTREELIKLAEALKQSWKGAQNLPLPASPKGKQWTPSESGEDADTTEFYPFRRIIGSSRFFRAHGQSCLDVLLPSYAEFLDGKLHETDTIAKAKGVLKEVGWVWILGNIGSGKTTAALQIGLSHEYRNLPLFYLNFSNVSSNKLDTLVVFKNLIKKKALVILDNIHLDLDFAETCYAGWRQNDNAAGLILVSTNATPALRGDNAADSIAAMVEKAITQAPGSEDFKKIMLRYAERCGLHQKKQLLGEDEIHRFAKLYGRNVLAFLKRLSSVANSSWYDVRADADFMTSFVTEHYVSVLPEAERHDLLRLAAFSFLGIRLELRLFPQHFFDRAMAMGLVVVKGVSDDGPFIKIFHSQVAERIVAGRPSTVEVADLYFDVIEKSPLQVYTLMQALEQWDNENALFDEEPINFRSIMTSQRAKSWIKREKISYIDRIIQKYPPIDEDLEIKLHEVLSAKEYGGPIVPIIATPTHPGMAKKLPAVEVSLKIQLDRMAKSLKGKRTAS